MSQTKEINWDGIPLLTEDALQEKLDDEKWSSVSAFLKKHSAATQDASKRSATVSKWLSWCGQRKNSVRVVEADIPAGIMPHKIDASLIDIKIGGKRGPDDALYNKSQELREKVARGNTILYMRDSGEPGSKPVHDNVIFALRKFTGGMGDEDEDQPDSNKTWMNYFLKPVESSDRVVCMHKANGEAAHFSARWVRDRFVVFTGSKNVHLAARSAADAEKYRDGRFLVARNVATSVMEMLAGLPEDKASVLLSFMHHTQVTAVLEILQPTYQHVVDLSYLEKGELNFIAWTLPYDDDDNGKADSYCAMNPQVALDFATHLRMKSVSYEVIETARAEERMEKVRRDAGYEGEVLYFLDARDNVIGLLKKKTAWYVVLRAIREKACAALADYKKSKADYSHASKKKKLATRLEQIQTWIGFPDDYLKSWTELGGRFLAYVTEEYGDDKLRGAFPVVWNKFLRDKQLEDTFEWN